MTDAGNGGEQPDVGSLAEEASKLFATLSGWAREHAQDLGDGASDLASQAAHLAGDVNDHIATGAPECTYCPVCRGVQVIRHLNPEVKAHLAVAVTSLAHATAALLAPPEQSSGEASPDVEHIDLDDDWTP